MKDYSESELEQAILQEDVRAPVRSLIEKTDDTEEQVGGLIQFLFHVGFTSKTISRILNRPGDAVHDIVLNRLSSNTPDIPYLLLKRIRSRLEEGLGQEDLNEDPDELRTLLQEAAETFQEKGLATLSEQVQHFILPVLDTFSAPEKYEKALNETSYLFDRSKNMPEELISLQDEIDRVLQDRVESRYRSIRNNNRPSTDNRTQNAVEQIIEQLKGRIDDHLGISNYYAEKRIAKVMKPRPFGERLKEWRDGIMTQQEICAYPGTPGRSHLSNIESGKVHPSFGTATALLDALNNSRVSNQIGERTRRGKRLLEAARHVSGPGEMDKLPETVTFETLSAYLRVYSSIRGIPLEVLEEVFLCNPYFHVGNGEDGYAIEALLFLSGMHDRNDHYLLCHAPGELVSLDRDEVDRIRTGGYVFSRMLSLPDRNEDPTPAGLTRICHPFTTEEIRPVVDYLDTSNMVEFDRNNEKDYFPWEELIRVDSNISFWILDAAGLESPFISPSIHG